MAKKAGWYPLSSTGRIVAATYVCIPAYAVTAQWLGVFPDNLKLPLIGGMTLVMLCGAISKKQKLQPFRARPHGGGGFTLVELLVVISIIGILAMIIFPQLLDARRTAYFARAKAELRNVAVAVERYGLDTGSYPADANRNLPSGLEQYLAPGNWPLGPWPGSVYDWENWSPSSLQYSPKVQTYQISIRFCSAPGVCNFPNEPWAANFDYYSAVYYCISGSCRSHSDMPPSHPGLCINC